MTGNYCELCGARRQALVDPVLPKYDPYGGARHGYLYVCVGCEARLRPVPVVEPSRESVQP